MTNYNTMAKYFGPKETDVMARLSYEKISVITKEQFDKLFEFEPQVRKQIIFRLNKKGVLKTLTRGIYFYSPIESGPSGQNINEFLVPPILFPSGNYYIGYSTMYNYYGLTDQIFQFMYVLNTSVQREKIIGNIQFKMLKISPKRMYGLEKVKINNTEVIVSDKERTLVDLIYFPEPVGGLKNAFEILKEQIKNIDMKKFIKYVLKFTNILTMKRIGFVLEQSGIDDKPLAPLVKRVKKTSLVVLYKSKSRKGKINKKWMLIENDS